MIRLVQPEERLRWDSLMAERHELGFLRFVGRGLRYVAVLGTLWVGLAGWQAGALKCRPRDRLIGRKAVQQYERLLLVASNTRLLVLPKPGAFPNLGRWFVGGMLRRLSGDWKATYGCPLELGEIFVDPETHHGTVYRASNLAPVGLTKGYARGRGGYTDPHGKLKEMYVYPLGRSSVARLCATEPHPDWAVARTAVDVTGETLPSLLEALQRVPASAMPRGGGTSWRQCWPSACWRALRARSAAMRPRATRKPCRRNILPPSTRGGIGSATASSRLCEPRSTG